MFMPIIIPYFIYFITMTWWTGDRVNQWSCRPNLFPDADFRWLPSYYQQLDSCRIPWFFL